MGIDCSRFPGPIIPVIYNVNLRNPDGYFLATKFQMRDKDVLYVSNATSVDRESAGLFATGRGDGQRPDRGGAERDHPAQPDQDRAVALLTRPMSPPAQAGGLARREPGSADALRAVQSREVPGVIDEEQITGVMKILADEIFGFKLEGTSKNSCFSRPVRI
jgi:hypothetical protein